ncbi:hypothetical protein [Actinomadura sp. WMMB 499]|uniref:hypothetical protein n=1 Tax=Actinomadura sp. WMMB 499 TaxID=1219491 RepID=UPI001246F46A|nr:hypothetical protein [Actinomadura sp. WMMB 499]QFG25435.1 hypothetical protein F7P10_34025 [Actinomadura sp. WMMB 499]
MIQVQIEIFHNVAKDENGRSLGFFGYEPNHPVVKVFEYLTEQTTLPPEDVAEEAMHIGNGVDNRSDSYYARELRSVSVGDLIRIDGQWWTCERVGWRFVGDIPKDITDEFEGEHGTQPWRD